MTSSLCTGDQTSDVVPSGLTSPSLVDDTQSVTRVRAEPHTHRAAPVSPCQQRARLVLLRQCQGNSL